MPEQLARQMDGALLAIGALSETLKAKVRLQDVFQGGDTHHSGGPRLWLKQGCACMHAVDPQADSTD